MIHETDLAKLSPADFEILVRDLATQRLSRTFESFSAGRDGGIDIRSSDDGPLIVIQCKRYNDSTQAQLVAAVREERDKVRGLGPDVYILASSRRATPTNLEELERTIRGWANETEVWTAHQIVQWLNSQDAVLRRHPKLWLASRAVLDAVFHADIHNRSAEFLQTAHDELRIFASNEVVAEAGDRLARQRIVILTGDPGVGKTTIARNLALQHAAEGYEIVVLVRDIAEAHARLDATAKQLFIFDDFLGKSKLIDIVRRNEGSDLSLFCSALRRTDSSRLIMTSRDYILSAARHQDETMEALTDDIEQLIVSVEKYTDVERAHILYNHLYHSQLQRSALIAFVDARTYNRVIHHRYYNPRLISQIVELFEQGDTPPAAFPEAFLSSLDDPSALWQRIFDRQLGMAEQYVLVALLVFGEEELDIVLEKWRAIASYAEASMTANELAFQAALQVLEPTFVRITSTLSGQWIEFANPGIEDVVSLMLRSRRDLVRAAIQAATEWEDMVGLATWSSPEGQAVDYLDLRPHADAIFESLRLLPHRAGADVGGVSAACHVAVRAGLEVVDIPDFLDAIRRTGDRLGLPQLISFYRATPGHPDLNEVFRGLVDDALTAYDLQELDFEDGEALVGVGEEFPDLFATRVNEDELRDELERVVNEELDWVAREGASTTVESVTSLASFFGLEPDDDLVDAARRALDWEEDDDEYRDVRTATVVESDVHRLFGSLRSRDS
jgi:hypothetical protein